MEDSDASPGFCPSIKVFGSALIRVNPDTVSVSVGVSRLAPTPEAAFDEARRAAGSVASFLRGEGISDFGSSRVSLARETRVHNGETQFEGYLARIQFELILRELDRLEAVLSGVVAAGANLLTSVTYQTTRLKPLRADARRRAVAAARAKAELYAAAAGVVVEGVLTIEDVNPQTILSRRFEGHVLIEPETPDDTREPESIDPGAITVAAAVSIVYRIGPRA